jgi:hypothetical protein
MPRALPKTSALLLDRGAAGRRALEAAVAQQKRSLLGPIPELQSARRPPSIDDVFATAEALPGWDALRPKERERLTVLLSGRHSQRAARARHALLALASKPRFNRRLAEGQANKLREIIPTWSPPGRGTGELRTIDMQPVKVFGADDLGDYTFETGTFPAIAWHLQIGHVLIDLIAPTTYDPRLLRNVIAAFSSLPLVAIEPLSEVLLEPRLYAKQRGAFPTTSMGIRDTTIHVFPTPDIFDPRVAAFTFAHEAGHGLSVSAWGWGEDSSSRAWAPWREAIRQDRMVVSLYAKKDPAEDFAETFAIYCTSFGTPTHDEYRGFTPHRFALIDAMLKKSARS